MTSRIGRLGLALALSAGLGYVASDAFAGTGSRLGGNAQPQLTLWVNPPSDIEEILTLLQNGESKEAIGLARELLEVTSASVSEGSTFYQYFALNALCVALSTDG